MSGFGQQATTADHVVPLPGDAGGISSLNFSSQSHLCASDWDGCVRYWEVAVQPPPMGGQAQWRVQPKTEVKDEKAVLDTCFSPDGRYIFFGGCGKAVKMWDIASGSATPTKVGEHAAPVKAVHFVQSSNLVVSGGWDGMLKVSAVRCAMCVVRVVCL